jgi:hypothetical protein
MKTSDYTRKQRDCINAAWNMLESTIDKLASGYSIAAQLTEAVTRERKDTDGCWTYARALTLRAFHNGYMQPQMPARLLTGLRTGLMVATVTGAAVRNMADSGIVMAQLSADLRDLMAMADKAQDAASQRAFEAGMNTSARHGVR